MSTFRRAAFLAAFLTVASGAQAQVETETTNLNVKVTIAATCAISANDVNFGSAATSWTNVDAQGSLRVNCASGHNYSITLGVGSHANGNNRRMAKGSDMIDYELYADNARTTRWDTMAGTGNGQDQIIPVYGRIASANVAPGLYSDVVTATMTY